MTETKKTVRISEPNLKTAIFNIEGISPFVQLRFSEKSKGEILAKHMAGSQAKKGGRKKAKDPDALFEGAMYKVREGWRGIPTSSFRNALISACRLVDFKMTIAKLAFFIEPDGFDAEDGTPLVKITGEPRLHIGHVRNATGVIDLRVRAMWENWSAQLRVTYDADLFNETDIANLLAKAGLQVGVGEGRPDSKKSAGMGWGQFKVR